MRPAPLACLPTTTTSGGSSYNLGGTLINTGTIVQQGAGSLEMYDNTILSNQGTYQFAADSNILYGSAAPNSFVNTATGVVKKTAGTGTSSIEVPFDNQGGTVDAESGTLTLADGGTSTGGTYIANGSGVIDLTGGSSPTFTGTYTGSGTGAYSMASGTLVIGAAGATFDFPSGLFTWSGGTFTGTLTNASAGFITISGVSAAGTFDNLGTITQTGGSLNVVNSGTFTASSGTVNLSGGNGGTLTETSCTVNVLSGTFAGLNTLTGSGGTYNITGTLTNTGTLALSGSAVSPAYNLHGGTIDGGTISTPDGGELIATQSGGTLNGVTLAGTLFTGQIINTYVDIQGGLTLATVGLVTMYGNGELDFLGSQSLSGTGTVSFEDNLIISNSFNPSGLKGLYVPSSGNTLTIASGVTIDGDTGFVGSTTGSFITNDGTIAATAAAPSRSRATPITAPAH